MLKTKDNEHICGIIQWIGPCLLLSKSNSIPQGATTFHPVSLAISKAPLRTSSTSIL